MEAYFTLKMKRKELDDDSISNFSDFALSSPARKIRRLDAELTPIIEDDDVVSSPAVPEFADLYGNSSSPSGGVQIEELPSVPGNEERAIVLFNPANSSNSSPLNRSPSNFSVSVHPDLISGFKNQVLWSNKPRAWRVDSDEAKKDDTSGSSNGYGCMAVVPWVPSKIPSAPLDDVASEIENVEAMDAEDMEGVEMDVEEAPSNGQTNMNGAGWVGMNEGLHQWQQHCMFPQPPENTTPLVWYR